MEHSEYREIKNFPALQITVKRSGEGRFDGLFDANQKGMIHY